MNLDNDKRINIGRAFIALVALMGVWVILSPMILGYGYQVYQQQNDVVVGFAIVLFAAIGGIIGSPNVALWSDILNFVLGLWLVIVPFLLGGANLSVAGMISDWVAGAVIVLACIASVVFLPIDRAVLS